MTRLGKIVTWVIGLIVFPMILVMVFLIWFLVLTITLLLGIQQMIEEWVS